ncbi:MAG: enoyl-CoA hydratase/isomerase family protein [Proteobacteria bacterium]|nr:enoyl-CoA hydratase/isomerase family protein [Pseudomonadota bacterium]
MDYERYQALQIRREDRVLRVTINRPEARNAINRELHAELTTVFDDIERDRETDAGMFTGAGGAFSAGGDLMWLLDMSGDAVALSEVIRSDRRIQNSMLDMEKPIIARIVGPAVGLGCSLALYCDFIYATPESRLADPHVSVGLVTGDGGAVIWPQLIGYARAKRYLLTGDPITGAEAAEMGLITEAVPEDRIDEVVDGMARRMVEGAKHAVRWSKASINAGLKQLANSVIDRSAGYEIVSQMTEDHRIALEAMLAKQKPVYTGR